MKILFIGPTRIGDTILASSIINFLIDQNNQSKFTVVTSPFSKDLYEKMPNLEKIIVINKKKYGLHWLNIWRSCIFIKWDLVVDLRSSITAYLLFTKSRKIFKGNDNFHKIIQFTNFLKTSKKISPLIWSDSIDEAESNNKIKNEGPFIAVAPYSNWNKKDWSIEKYLELFKDEFFKDYTLIFTGISKDIPNVEKFYKLINDPSLNIINLFDWGNLRHMIPIFNQCKFFIGSDSGLMHLAASTNCKTFALFGPTNEIVYGPWGDHKVIKSLNYPAIDDPLNLPVEKVLNIIKKEMG